MVLFSHSATFKTNLGILDVKQANILGENQMLTIFSVPRGLQEKKNERSRFCQGKFLQFLHFYVIWAYIHHISRPEKNGRT